MTEPVTWTAADAGACLRTPNADDDKYSRGVVGLRTGSDLYPGAAVLGVEAAWRTGVGMVRYLGPAHAEDLVLRRRPETVTAPGRVQAWVIGSGTAARAAGASGAPGTPLDAHAAEEAAALDELLSGTLPVVVDAGALALADRANAPCVITPHAREHAALRAQLGLAEAPRLESARETAARLEATVVLKGAQTLVATPSGWTALIDIAPPWLATAGTGDVLAGVLGAVIACAQARAEASAHSLRPDALGPLAATAAWLHARAGALAASRAGGGAGDGPIVALDVAHALPEAVAQALAASA